MITIDKLKDFKLSKERFIVPVDKEDIHKSSCVILFTRHQDSILSVLNNPFMDDKNLFKHVYRARDITLRIKADKVIEKGTKMRNEYYETCRKKLKLSGIIALSNLGEKNFYFDTYREHELFLDNTGKLNKLMKTSEYLTMLNAHFIDIPIVKDYKVKTVLIQLEDWIDNVSEDNPASLLHYASWKLFDKFKELGDIDFVFITKEAVFKMNPLRCTNTSHVEFLKALKTLNKTVVLSDNEDGNVTNMINSEIDIDDDEDSIDDELAEKIQKQEEQGRSSDEIAENIMNDPEEAKKIADKVLEPIIIKKDAISKRDMELREKQKNLKIDGVTMGELHDRKVDYAAIPVNDVSGSVNTLNKNITRVQFVNFPETYNEHHYQRDIMSIADAMKDKSIPIFVRDMKKEDTSDSLNQKETYTFYLEDSNRGRHTLKFDMPKFVEGKYMYLNGHKKEFNNQRIAKPLIKTGPDTVQVVTNYNKIFMTRHGEKVEALYEKFKELVISDPKHFSYKRGDCSRLNTEYKTTIEYDTLAKQFAEIVVKPPKGDRLHLVFSQPKLKEICCTKLGAEGLWKKIQESGTQMVAGYYEGLKKSSLYILDLNAAEITPEVTKESVGDAFPAFEYAVSKQDEIYISLERIQQNIDSMEGYMVQVMDEYQIDPSEIFFDIDIQPVNEGILSSIWKGLKDLVKSLLKMVMKIWNGIASIVRFFFKKISSFFGGGSSSGISKPNFVPQEVSFISLESAKVETTEVHSQKELQQTIVEHIESISREIRDRSQIQIDSAKELGKLVDEKEEAVQERAVIGRELDFDAGEDYKFSMPGRDIVASKQMITSARFDSESFSLINKANDVAKAYNEWIEGDIERILKTSFHMNQTTGSTPNDESFNEYMVQATYVGCQSMGMKKEEIIAYIKGKFYDIPEDPEAIKLLVKLRLNYNKKICSLLEEMLRINYALLGVTVETSNAIIARLREGDAKAIGQVNEIIEKNKSSFVKELCHNGFRHNYIDFSSIGGGICYYTHEDLRNIKELFLGDSERFFNLALRFDYVVLGHGGVGHDHNKENELFDTNEEYAELHYRRSDIEFDTSSGKPVKRDSSTLSDDERKKLEEIHKKLRKIESDANITYWLIQPVATQHFPATDKVNDLIRNIIEEGHMAGKTRMRIFLLCCNGGHFVLDDDVRNAKGVTLICASNKMLGD